MKEFIYGRNPVYATLRTLAIVLGPHLGEQKSIGSKVDDQYINDL